MKTVFNCTLAIAMTIGMTTSGYSQKKHTTVVIKHTPTKKVVYIKTPKKQSRLLIGTVIYELPKSATPILLNKHRYIKHRNVLYTKVNVKGRRAYKVVRYV